MSAEERKKILQMVSEGKITADDAAKLMRVLDEPADDEIEVIETESSASEERSEEASFEDVRRRAFHFSNVILWCGVILTALVSWGMFSVQQADGYNFWFFCLAFPLMLGIILITLGGGGRTAHWMYVNVDRSQREDWPKKISLAFPLPLGLAAWFLRNFGTHIDGLKQTAIDEIIQGIANVRTIKEPLIINVDETEKSGERVQVFIG
jgi:hypothetical protein